MTTTVADSTFIDREAFHLPNNFLHELETTMRSLPNGSAFGSDGLYCEILKVAPKEAATALNSLRIACGTLRYTPSDWRNGIAPLYEMEDP